MIDVLPGVVTPEKTLAGTKGFLPSIFLNNRKQSFLCITQITTYVSIAEVPRITLGGHDASGTEGTVTPGASRHWTG